MRSSREVWVKTRAEKEQLDVMPARPTCTHTPLAWAFSRKEGTRRGNLAPVGKGSMPGPPGGGSLVLIPALPGQALTLVQPYLDQKDTVVTTAKGSIHRAGEVLPPFRD